MSAAPSARTITAPGLDLGLTLSAVRIGVGDPCMVAARDGSWAWASRSPDGAVTVRATPKARGIRLHAWGPGAEWALERGPELVGAGDPTIALSVEHPVVADLLLRFAGLRLVRTHGVVDAAMAGVCRRGVSAFEASRAWSLMVESYGDDAPGPGGLRLPPAADRVAAASPYELHVMGLDAERAAEIRRIASHAARLLDDGSTELAVLLERLGDLPGVGPDVVAHARCVALGDPSAIPVVDAHVHAALSRVMGAAVPADGDLTGLLAEFAGQAARVVRVVEAASAIRLGPSSP